MTFAHWKYHDLCALGISAGYGKVDKKILDTDCMTINIGHMGINKGFIYERE